jgi:hypothetical protein
VSHVTTSILNDTKKALGIAADYTVFDDQLLMFINGVLSRLTLVGIGPEEGVLVEDADATWDAVIGTDNRKNMAKSYVYARVRQLFDPPTTSFHIESLNKIIAEYEWCLNVVREETEWTDPTIEVEV